MGDCRRILLVGFMASGKSAVGRALARRLGWAFHDFDEAVEAEEGRSVARIFAESGEAYFRDLETSVARRLLSLDQVVLASGGGWPTRSGRWEDVLPGTCSVWLKVTPEEVLRRIGSEAGKRPLLATDAPLQTARNLLDSRVGHYRRCDVEVDTDAKSVEDVAARILILAGLDPANHTPVETR